MVRLSVHKCFGSAEILLISQGWYFRLDALHPLHYPPNDLAISDCKHGASASRFFFVCGSGLAFRLNFRTQDGSPIGTQMLWVSGNSADFSRVVLPVGRASPAPLPSQ